MVKNYAKGSRREGVKSSISINDIENMRVEFDGSQFQNVEKWLADFVDVVSLFNVSDFHKLTFAKRRMAGRAKLFIQS